MRKILIVLGLCLAACLPAHAQYYGQASFYGGSAGGGGTANVSNQVKYAVSANSSGTAANVDSIVCTPPSVNGQYAIGYTVSGAAAVAPTCPLVGLVPDAAAGAAVLYSDNNTVIYNPAAALSLPTPTTLGNPNFYTVITTPGGTAVTLTPVTWTVSLNGGVAGGTAAIPAHARCTVLIDQVASTQWDVDCVPIGAAGSGTVTSAGQTMPVQFAIANSPITTSGTLADTYLDPNKNLAIDPLTPFQVLQAQRRTTTILAQGTGTYSPAGDSATETSSASANVAPTATAPIQSQETTTGTISTAAGVAGNLIHRTGRAHGITLFIGSQQNVVTNDRTSRCLTDQSLATQIGSDVPAGNYACITYSTTGTYTGLTDTTHYVCLTKNNVTQNAVASTVAADTAYHVFGIREDITNSSYHFYIDFVEVCGTGITTDLPTSGTNMRYVSAAWDLAASTVLIDNGIVQIVEDK